MWCKRAQDSTRASFGYEKAVVLPVLRLRMPQNPVDGLDKHKHLLGGGVNLR